MGFLCRQLSLSIAYGSQTGNAALFATQLAERLTASKWDVALSALDEKPASDLLNTSHPLVVVCSVFGEGEPPDNAKAFYQHIMAAKQPVASGKFAVFGLGDTRYALERFNVIGRHVDERLAHLGKQRMAPFCAGDAGDDVEHDFEVWSEQLLKQLGEGESAKEAVVDRVVMVSGQEAEKKSFYREFDAQVVSSDNPASLTCLSTRSVLPGEWSERPCKEIVLGEIAYETGDYLGVYPPSHQRPVEAMLKQFKLTENDRFVLDGFSGTLMCRRKSFPKPVSIGEFLSKYCDLHRPVPAAYARKLLNWTSGVDKQRIAEATDDKKSGTLFKDLFWFKSIPEVLQQFPSLSMGLRELVEFLPPSRPSYYSLASSKARSGTRARLVVGSHRFAVPSGGFRDGLCATYLTEVVQPGSVVESFVKASAFKLPTDPATPVVMIGVGSGLAPFLGFMEERVLSGGRNNTLYFGCMRREWDFIYGKELEAWAKEGVLDLKLACSHADPNRMEFVQHLMARDAKQLWRLLNEQNAHVYVCGHMRMGAGVEQALRDIATAELGNVGLGTAFVDRLVETSRLKTDVFA